MIDANLIKHILVDASKLALTYYLKVTPTLKDNQTYVTDADLAVQAFLRRAFEQHFPEDGIVAEENDLRKPPVTGQRTWVIDPIDGTAAFSAGLPIWGIAVGLVVGGQVTAGFFYQPVTRDLFYTTSKGQVFRNDHITHLREPRPLHRETSLFIASRLHQDCNLSSSYPGKLRNFGSSVAHLAYVATGSADAALMERIYIWDIAAGMAMLLHNGGTLQYVSGAPVELDKLLDGSPASDLMLAGHPQMVTVFREMITRDHFTDE